MGEILIGLLLVLTVGGLLLLGLLAFFFALIHRGQIGRLYRRLGSVESRLYALEQTAKPRPAAAEAEATAPGTPAASMPTPTAPASAPDVQKEHAHAEAAPAELGGGSPAPAFANAGTGPDEPRPSFESTIGKRWMTWVGAVVLFCSAGFFLKYAFENDWIGPTGQVVLCALVGLVAMLGGHHFVAKGWRILGQGLVGLGLAVLYATFFAGFSLYSPAVLPQTAAFGLMVAVTVAGMRLAVLHDAQPVACLAVLGGLLTPVLVSTGTDARDVLFGYLLLLDAGVLAVAFVRQWRALDTLALAGTIVLYAGWFAQYYGRSDLIPALAWLAVFYLVFLALPFAYHLVRQEAVGLARFLMALADAVFAFGYAWSMLHEEHASALGFVALGLAAAYVGLGALLRRRIPSDARSLFAAVALATVFLTLAVPLHLRAHGITLAWAVEGPVLLYLGYRFRYGPVRGFGAAVLVVAVVRLFAAHWPPHHDLFVPFANRHFLSAMAAPVAMAVYAVIHRVQREHAGLFDRFCQFAAGLGAGVLGLIVLHGELGSWLDNEYNEYVSASGLTLLWTAGAAAYLAAGVRVKSVWPWLAGTLLMPIALVLGLVAYVEGGRGDALLFAHLGFVACLALVLTVFTYAVVSRRTAVGGESARRVLPPCYRWCGILLLLGLLSMEVYRFCDNSRSGQMGITLVWGLYAIGLLAVGFWRRHRPFRLFALGLFGLAALKLVLIDMTHVEDIFRVISFMGLGLLMIGASYLYHRLEKHFFGGEATSEEPPGAAAAADPGETT